MSITTVLSADPSLRFLQLLLLASALLSIFFVLYTTRDVLLRSESFWFQFLSIILVACMPVVGFLFYLLIRPSRTLWQRELSRTLHKLIHEVHHLTKKKENNPQGKAKGQEQKIVQS